MYRLWPAVRSLGRNEGNCGNEDKLAQGCDQRVAEVQEADVGQPSGQAAEGA